ncbi:DNA translocase FtsK 4TM domain-containing protein [Reyranella aquatilis]|uniref:DNA translocase FtsK n=1 Tax=Reyranella aquatilis TaxID=2035356 RepID=A0ABS8L0T4_9HYPH|nr:DNA translocase FtsK [Reyranella aquatilis]MCC8431951.1 DNA translocase FtsK 4TM domain-containing protein [Reyranella aquatilis]
MAMLSVSSALQPRTSILPEGGRDFLRRRMMEIVGVATAGFGLMLMMALFTYSPGDPSLNHATARAPNNLLGLPGAYISDLLLQTFGLAIILAPVAFITWGVRMVRTHHLGFFGLRLSLLLLALLMMSVACVGLGDVGGAATHAGPGGLVGLALVGRFRELVLTHSSGGALTLIEPVCAALAFIAMAPALGMNRTDLPLIFRILRAPFLWTVWGARAAVGLWRGKPQNLEEESEPPAPHIGYAEIPGEIDASQYDPARFENRYEQIPEEGTAMPARDSLMVDAPYAPIERPADDIPAAPEGARLHSPVLDEAAPARTLERGFLSRLTGGLRIEPFMRRSAPASAANAERIEPGFGGPEVAAAPPQYRQPLAEEEFEAPPRAAAPPPPPLPDEAVIDEQVDENPFTPDSALDLEQPVAAAAQPAVKIVPRKAAVAQGKRAAKAGQRELDLGVGEYKLPPLDILSLPSRVNAQPKIDEEALEQNARLLETVLDDFGVKGQIVKVRPGPVVTLYELEPAPGTKSSRVIGLADDIARSMSAVSARVATVPGRNVIGIELPNAKRETVFLRELLSTKHYEDGRLGLPLALGKDIGGDPVIADLARMPHLLIGGTTGSGKSVAVNTMILSLLYRLPPDKCRFIMIDPKMLELSVYQDIPHLLTPVVTEPRKAIVALKWVVREMEDRYRAMSAVGVRNIAGYNEKLAETARKGGVLTRKVQTGIDPETRKPTFEDEEIDLRPLPFIVVIIDEMADLMLVAGKEIEAAVQRLAQMARAAGIHVVMATQRPSVDVITGTIKANFPTRISFQVTSKIDSRTILGEQGGEQLLGQGDMLYMAGGGKIARVHGPFVSDGEVEEVVRHLRAQGAPAYIDAVTDDPESEGEGGGLPGDGEEGESDQLYDQAIALVARERKCSTSFIQRYLQIGYNRAARIVERMEREGVVSSANHVGKREVLARDIDDRER